MAEFLHILAEQYDYPQLADEILRELSNKEFNSNDTKGPKSVSTFMIRLSELAPRLVIKQVTLMAKQLDSEVCWLDAGILGSRTDMRSHTRSGAPSWRSSATCSLTSASRMSAARTTKCR
jgi:condensin complex subunit 1